MKRVQHLANLQPDHAESRIALARAGLAANLWGEARHHLSGILDDAKNGAEIDARVYRLMADIETAEHGDAAAAGRWLAKPSRADSGWICGACGGAHDAWQAVCGHCGAFDRLQWRAPRNLPQAALKTGSNLMKSDQTPPEITAPA
ncbi:MAG: hypothetical protein JKY20_10990 [Alphaproteobacteria bacterium]|nr:hypothetical protein [Alphaproteobacteria bacterium]